MANNLTIYRGVTYPSVYQHTDGSGNALPLTGCTVFFTIKNQQYDDDSADTTNVPFKATVTSHTDAAAGITGWDTLFPATGFDPGTYYYDIVIKDSTGKELPPVLIGTCKVLGKRTNRTS